MHLSPEEFNAFLGDLGQQMAWRQSFACPCINPNSGAAKPGCPNCKGKGHFWSLPLNTVAGMSGQGAQKQWAQFGNYEQGDVVITIGSDSPMYAIGQFDRVTLLNNDEAFSMPLTRGMNDVLHFQVVRFTRCFWLNQAGALVDGGLPVVDGAGVLSWPAGGEPPQATQYSLCGVRSNEYYCFDSMPSERNEHSGAQLPKKVVLRKFDLFGR